MANLRPVRRGAVLVTTAIVLTVLIGFSALALDLGFVRVIHAELQRAADAAALAGMEDLQRGGDTTHVEIARQSVLDFVAANPLLGSYAPTCNGATDVVFGQAAYDSSGAYLGFTPGAMPADTVQVTVHHEVDLWFSQIFGHSTSAASAGAVASLRVRTPIGYWRLGELVGIHAADETSNHDGTYNGESEGSSGDDDDDDGDDDDDDGDDDDDDGDDDDDDDDSGPDYILAEDGIVTGNTSVDFLGQSGFMEVPHSDDFLIDEGAVSVWFNSDNIGTTQGVWSKDSNGYDDGGHLDIRIQNGKIRARLQSTNSSHDLWSGNISANDWHHVVVTFGSKGFELYVNGVATDSSTYTGGLGTSSGGSGNTEPITIGVSQTHSGNQTSAGWTKPFNGRIDEAAIYDRQLTKDQVKWLHDAVTSGSVGLGAIARDSVLSM